MSLALHVNPDRVIAESREHAKKTGKSSVHDLMGRQNPSHTATHDGTEPLPKYSFPSHGRPAQEAYEIVNTELSLDGNPLLNLASFVHTSMEDHGTRIMIENMSKNLIDSDEYPATTLLHARCVSMLAKLWHADDQGEQATGTATTGSSEAIALGGLAMKKRWQAKMKAAGKSIHEPGPNIVMGANAQVALEKFARYFDVEARMVPVDKSTNYCMDPKRAIEMVDENTIGVFVILGSTYTGHYENVQEMSDLLDEYEAKTGISVPIHVDGASGALYAPFATPSLVWDFRIKRVVSINTSGHKWGKAYVGVGWVIFRDKEHLPKELVFELHYLGSVEYSYSINFSRPAAPILAQYFNFLYLGFDGYRKISLHDAKNARLLARALENSKYYTIVSDIHKAKNDSLVEKAKQSISRVDDIEHYVPSLPVVAFMFSDEFKKEYPSVKQSAIQHGLRQFNWIVPNYELPPNAQDEEVLRVVIREKFNEDMVERLVVDIINVTEGLMKDAKQQSGSEKTEEKKVHKDSERRAANHGEGVRPTGHDSVC
ncbi:uncharacterized protein JCM15063_004306 [Sporobolomyces koalae]|uniref:uncharacterized protein n=1 Tax=Sporobolomyces koalae TaxID=500713 RepID=UPI00317D9620